MGTLQTTIRLEDKVSQKLKTINRNINKTVKTMALLNQVGNSFSGGSMSKAVQSWANASKAAINSVAQAQKTAGKMAHDHQKSLDKRLEMSTQSRLQRERAVELANINVITAKKIAGARAATQIAIENRKHENRLTLEKQKQLNWQERINASLDRQKSKYQGIFGQLQLWGSRIRNIVTMYYTIKSVVDSIGEAVRTSDQMTNNYAKLGLIADSKNSVKDLEAKSFGAAQRSSTDYLEFTKAVTKMGILAGDKFGSQDDIIRFVELMNKSFQISGAETSERQAAMLQITQAIASNRLQGDEFRSILENAPLVMQSLTKSLGVGQDKLKAMAKEGQITADVLIKAMFDASEKIESMYTTLPLTWERIWVKMKNVFYIAFKPIQKQFQRLFNSQKFARILNATSKALVIAGNIIAGFLSMMIDLGSWMIDMWDKHKNVLKPIISLIGLLIGATMAYFATVGVINAIKNAWMAVAGAMKLVAGLTLSTAGIFVAVVALIIGLTYLIIQWINNATGSVISGIGVIVGGFYWLWSVIVNIVKGILLVITWAGQVFYNIIFGIINSVISLMDLLGNIIISIVERILNITKGGFDTFGGFVANVIGQIISWFLQLGTVVTTIIDAIFGTDWTSGLNALQDKVLQWGKNDKAITLERNIVSKYVGLDRHRYSDALDTFQFSNPMDAYYEGYEKGSNFETKIANLSNYDLDLSKAQLTTLNGINDKLGEGVGDLGDISKNTGDTAKNTSKTEDYSYLRDWSYQKGLGSSIGYNIKIEQNNRNNIGSNMDLNRVVDAVRDAIIEGIYTQAEKVY